MRAVIGIHEEAGRTEATYAPPIPAIGLQLFVFCAIGGLALGLAGTLALIVFDYDAGRSFHTLLLGLTAAGAVLIYALGRLTSRPQIAVRVSVDVLSGRVSVRCSARAECDLLLDDVVGFRLERPAGKRVRECLLVLDRVDDSPLVLFHARHPCHIRRSRLPEYAERLNLMLEAAGSLLNTLQAPAVLRPFVPDPAAPLAPPSTITPPVLPQWLEEPEDLP